MDTQSQDFKMLQDLIDQFAPEVRKCLLDNLTVRKTAPKLHVCSSTAFDWCHKMLSAITSAVLEQINGQVQCDETEVGVSMKGCRQLKRKPRKREEEFKRNDDDDSEPSTVQDIALSSNSRNELMIPVITKRLTAAEIKEAIGERLE